MSDKLTVEVYPDVEAIVDEKPVVYHGIDFVSIVNDGTFGKPALIAPNDGQPGVARHGQKVLYINTRFIPLYSIERAER